MPMSERFLSCYYAASTRSWDKNVKTCEREIVYDKEWDRYVMFMNGAESQGVNRYLGSPNGFEIIGNIYDT